MFDDVDCRTLVQNSLCKIGNFRFGLNEITGFSPNGTPLTMGDFRFILNNLNSSKPSKLL